MTDLSELLDAGPPTSRRSVQVVREILETAAITDERPEPAAAELLSRAAATLGPAGPDDTGRRLAREVEAAARGTTAPGSARFDRLREDIDGLARRIRSDGGYPAF